MRGGRRGRTNGRTVGSAFDPDDSKNVRHTQLGVWDLYEDKPEVLAKIPVATRLQPYIEMGSGLPYVWRMLKDISSIRSTWFLLLLLVVTHAIKSLIPAVTLWYSGQLLVIAQTAIDARTVDKHHLLSIAAGRVACSLLSHLLRLALNRLNPILNSRIKQHYSTHMFRVTARLDLATFNDDAVQEQLSQVIPTNSHSSIAWDTIRAFLEVFSLVLRLTSESTVLVRVVRNQPDGPLLALLSCLPSFSRFLLQGVSFTSPSGAWVVTTKNEDYIKMEGLKSMVGNGRHRQEIVAGEMWRYLLHEYSKRMERLGSAAVESFYQMYSRHHENKFWSLLQEPLHELPQIVFTLRAVERPTSIPLSLASFNLMSSTANSFSNQLTGFLYVSASIVDNIAKIRKLYEAENIPNKIVNGTVPYPENQADLQAGISIEFCNVSFKYPDAPNYALQNISFKIRQGQLCVIVGKNGSGKSTILKLVARFHDPEHGCILVDGQDIKTLKLEDLRRATAVLFQDYTHFPLSIGDNIGLGDPEHSEDIEQIIEAARLGGADDVVVKLPEGFRTYLERPVKDMYSSLPEGTKMLFGRPVDYTKLRRRGGMKQTESALSGGQMQRIALSRTFMRTLSKEKQVALLLFDEPSASLDPTAEHDLFERLRQLRGNKTMIFSSHRFGNLTRNADLILFIDDSHIIEEGTHADLLNRNGEYARIWKLQAQAFL